MLLAGAFLTGCATGNHTLMLDTVGPVRPPWNTADTTKGRLTVYSAYAVTADFNDRDTRRPEYSDYKICDADGQLLQRVHNNSGTILQTPVAVLLTPGKYQVLAYANGYGAVTIPVMIAAQQTTLLHLEGGNPWADESVFNETNAVRLPDGQIVGWRADR